MKKSVLTTVLIVGILLALFGLYRLGFLSFHDYQPSFTLNPDSTTHSDTNVESEGAPILIIENIKGKFNKITADIKNIGDQNARSVNWSISVEGGLLKRIDLYSTGTITTLSVQSITTVITDRIPLGFGRLDITVIVEASGIEAVTKTAQGFKLFFFVFGIRT